MATDNGAAPEHLIARLQDLERRGSARVAALRAAEAPSARRHALLFRLASHRLLTPMDHLLGIWPLPRTLTTVPGTARWVLGIANHRGELLPLYDLRGLLLADYEGIQRRGIALVVAGERRIFGLVVDAVIGLRRTHFEPQPPAETAPPSPFAALISGSCDCEDGAVPVIDPAAVERLPEFATGALAGAALPAATPPTAAT
jgi:twitching motility protein PilI